MATVCYTHLDLVIEEVLMDALPLETRKFIIERAYRKKRSALIVERCNGAHMRCQEERAMIERSQVEMRDKKTRIQGEYAALLLKAGELYLDGTLSREDLADTQRQAESHLEVVEKESVLRAKAIEKSFRDIEAAAAVQMRVQMRLLNKERDEASRKCGIPC